MNAQTEGSETAPAPLFSPVIASAATANSAFWRPKFVRRSEILPHLPFLFWLIDAARPARVVELGLGCGVSYFAACQALERLGLSAKAVGIDHWQGDGTLAPTAQEQEDVRRYNAEQFREFSELLEADIAGGAAARFAPASIDLLIVDLEITPPVLKSLRDEWLGRLSENAVLVLHGTGTRFEETEARAFLEDMSARHAAIRLSHGAGVAALLMGAAPGERLRRLAGLPGEAAEHSEIARVFERLGRACEMEWQQCERAEALAARDREIARLSDEAQAAGQRAAAKETELTELQRRLDTLERLREERRAAHEAERADPAAARDATGTRLRAEGAAAGDYTTTPAGRATERRDRKIAALKKRLEASETERTRLQAEKEETESARQRAEILTTLGAARRSRLERKSLFRRDRSGLPTARKAARLLAESELFDADWYRRQYPDAARQGVDPMRHYLHSGAFEGRDPGPDFDTLGYYAANPDVARAGFNALVHYLMFGRAEGRRRTPRQGGATSSGGGGSHASGA